MSPTLTRWQPPVLRCISRGWSKRLRPGCRSVLLPALIGVLLVSWTSLQAGEPRPPRLGGPTGDRLPSGAGREATEVRRPNILLIVSDDQRPDTIHALGNPLIQTPHLDQLATRGAVFTRAIAAYPICHVSRAEILTGCSAFRACVNYPNGPLDPELATLGGTLQQAGYSTCYTGKWHNDGQPARHGYLLTSGLFSSGGGRGVKAVEVDTQGHPVTGYVGWTFKTPDGRVELDKGAGLTPRTSQHIADGAIAFLHTRSAEPFFLHVNFAAPHDPRLMPPGYEGRYDPQQIPLPANFAPQHPFDHGNREGRDERLLDKPLDPDDLRRELACYHAVISHMDEQIGRILETLQTTGQAENTIVIFTSDQGLALGSHGLLGKQNMYEHTLGVPLIFAGPGIPPGQRFAALCYLRDLFPTCCELAGVEIPASVQAASLLPVLRGQADRVHDYLVGYFTDSQRMIRDARWKLIVYPQAGRQQLFDLDNDPLELHDLSSHSGQARRVADLQARLQAWVQLATR